MLRLALILAVSCLLGIRSSAGAGSCSLSAASYSFKFGEFNATVFRDSFVNLSATIFTEPAAAVRRSYFFTYPSEDQLTASYNTMLLERGNLRLLLDAGIGFAGESGPPGKLKQLMIDAGIMPSSITAVLITHAHFDHIGGVTNADGTAAFPNAKIYIHRKEYNFWRGDPVDLAKRFPDPDVSVIKMTVAGFKVAVNAYPGNVVLIDDMQTLFSGVQAIPTQGHTPGHTSFRITSRGKSMFVTGDSILSRATNLQNPTWTIYSDTNRTQAVLTRMKMIDSVMADKSLVLAFHEIFPGLGHFTPRGAFYDWSPNVMVF